MLKRLLCAAGVLIPVSAMAQPPAGPYVSGNLGAGIASGALRSAQSTAKVDLDTGPAGSLAIGWRFVDGFRAELDGNYQYNTVQGVFTPSASSGQLAPLMGASGHVSTYAVTANLIYDIPLQGWIRPYVGVGAGYGWLNFNDVSGVGYGTLHLPDDNTYTGPHTVQFGTAGALAYQARAGLSVPVRWAPGLALTAEYRFLGTARADVPVSRVAIGNNLVNGAIPASSNRYGFFAADNLITVGFRYTFGAH